VARRGEGGGAHDPELRTEPYKPSVLRDYERDLHTADAFCFTDDPNVSLETASFDITGGTGRFAAATGSGTFSVTALTHPQKGSGTLTAAITY
jgi:hypothetical protein